MEVEHKQKQLDAQLQVNQALMDKNVGVQKENCELKVTEGPERDARSSFNPF